MTKFFAAAALAVVATMAPLGIAVGQTHDLERKIWSLLDNAKAPFVALSEPDFRALGADFDLPDGGRSVTALAGKAPAGAFDPRDLATIPPQQLGYRADWVVERFRRYNLDWDIGALKLTSLNPEAKNYPWFIIMNGGAANFYEFYVDLKNRPGWTQFLAQKMNVMIVTIPGNFKYGGWDLPVMDPRRQPAYLLDRELPLQKSEIRNAIYTNSLILQGVKQLVMKHTTGDILLIGHSTSGEIAMLAYEDKELGPRLKGRFLGWGSGGPARLELMRTVSGKNIPVRGGASPQGHTFSRSTFSNAATRRAIRAATAVSSIRSTRRGCRICRSPSAGCRLKHAGARTSSSSCRTSSTARISARRRRSSMRSRCC